MKKIIVNVYNESLCHFPHMKTFGMEKIFTQCLPEPDNHVAIKKCKRIFGKFMVKHLEEEGLIWLEINDEGQRVLKCRVPIAFLEGRKLK